MGMKLLGMQETIESKLRAAFAPEYLLVVDESESHRGHAGFKEGGESHFSVSISGDAVTGKSPVAKHRAIYAALGPDVMGTIHALAVRVV